MLSNYVKVGIRTLSRHKLFSLINVLGLAIAMSVCLLVIMLLADQFAYDDFHPEQKRIFRVLSVRPDSDRPYASTPPSLNSTLRTELATIETSTSLVTGVGGDAVVGDKAVEMRGFFGDENFFKVFGFKLREGDSQTALNEPHSIIISEPVARALFKDADALGKTINFYDRGLHYLKQGKDSRPVAWGSFTITGVIDPKTTKSHLRFDVLMSKSTQRLLLADGKSNDSDGWDKAFTYVLAAEGQTKENIDVALQSVFESRFGSNESLKGFGLFAQPLPEVTPGIIVNQHTSFQLPAMAFYVLGFIAAIIMISACLNYANLSVARSLTRLKEIGVRKVSGARRNDLIMQFLTESMITTALAFFIACGILFFILPAFTSLWLNRYLELTPELNFAVIGYFAIFAFLIGIGCGVSPAIYLSRFQPTRALKNMVSTSGGKMGMRKFLNAMQFVISLFFIVTALLVYAQYKYFMNFRYGFQAKGIVNVELQGNAFDRVSQAFEATSGVSAVSGSQYVPATGRTSGMELDNPKGGDPIGFRHLAASEGVIDNLGLKLIAGTKLPPSADSISRYILLNETGAHRLGFANAADAVGSTVVQTWDREPFQVVGVVQDFWVKLPIGGDPLDPLFIQNLPHLFSYANVRIEAESEKEVLSKLERTWKQIDPLHPFKYQYYEDELDSTHAGIYDVVSIVRFLALIAVTIACMGMLGMAVYTVGKRRKEVGIRRVLGAGQRSLVILLSKEFLWILGIAVCIGGPLSWFVNNAWLQIFPTRAPFGWEIILMSVALLLTLGLLAIGSQALSAARTNPVDTIREQL
ncbi:ABC transporter permease [Chryseolinea sp. T2]|uniref:ABC transporter permease n=1 Tax=Chryseolinea sp. T2 TaxID=3129255 RepID=UPI003077FD8E